MSDGDTQSDFLDGFTLSPDWAKKSSESHESNLNKYSSRNEWGSGDSRRGKGGYRRDQSRDGGRGRGDERRQRPRDRSERPAFGEGARRDSATPPYQSPRRESVDAARQEAPRQPRRDFDRRDRQPLPPALYDIRFLPDQKALSIIARKVQSGHRAIPLRDLVKLFYDNPASTEVRLEFNAENKERRFYSCRKCGWFASSEEALRGHILTTHFDEYFDSETITVDPPSGNFTGVSRCGITGKLLAPPNHHSYNKVIQQMLRTECASYSEEAYRARIELVNTPEAIEQWKQEASQQIVYFAKPDPANARKRPSQKKKTKKVEPVVDAETLPEADAKDEDAQVEEQALAEDLAPPSEAATDVQVPAESDSVVDEASPVEPEPVQKMSAEEAEDLFSRTLLPKMMKTERQVTVSHAVSKAISDPSILDAISRAWNREQVIQTASLFFAVRGGLRSRKLALFRASDPRREEFVIHRAPTPLDPAHAAPELKQIMDYLSEHPGCTKTTMLAELIPSDAAPEAAQETLKQIALSIDQGYIIEYFNGVLALASAHPHYSAPSTKKKESRKPKVEKKAEAVPAKVAEVVKPKADPEPVVATEPVPVAPKVVPKPRNQVEVAPAVETKVAAPVTDPELVVEVEAESVDAKAVPESDDEPATNQEPAVSEENVESLDKNEKSL